MSIDEAMGQAIFILLMSAKKTRHMVSKCRNGLSLSESHPFSRHGAQWVQSFSLRELRHLQQALLA
jgi:hypothetical protein